MTHAQLRNLALAVLAAFVAILIFASCETAPHALPAYEPPLAKSDFQHVRTTAYTHTEADHLQYGNRNALGGELQAAGPAIHRAENRAPSISTDNDVDVIRVSNSDAKLQPFSLDEPRTGTRVTTTTTRITTKTVKGSRRAVAVNQPSRIGSAAADWSRWPVGTTFRLLSTGQVYRVDDYGWALSGRNTIDLYMATRNEMNNWGAREEPIQVLQWGDSRQSLQFLQSHQNYKHIKRMVLELEGHDQEAASLQ